MIPSVWKVSFGVVSVGFVRFHVFGFGSWAFGVVYLMMVLYIDFESMEYLIFK